jgi:hypothetical protein
MTARQIIEAEDPKRFLKQVASGALVRTKGDLRRYIARQLRRLPEREESNIEEWYRLVDFQIMPAIIGALERFYGKEAPDGTRGLFRCWVKNSQTERRAAYLIASFEGIIQEE